MFKALTLGLLAAAAAAPIDDYVWKADENYGWVDMGEEHVLHGCNLDESNCWTGYTLNMTSQRWLTDDDFASDSAAKSIWWHILVVIVPDEVKWNRNGSLWITGGSMGSMPTATDLDIVLTASLAMGTGVITGALFQIPNEKVIFSADPKNKSRTEDAIIAFTWDHFLNDPSKPEWLLRFPMVKASLRAMDAVTEFVAQKLPELGCQLDYYSVLGASKRGWTTWLVGAVDPNRVMNICPIVLDAVNFVTVEHHQWRSYNGFSWALQDYLDMDIFSRLDSPEMLQLSQNVDPYFFFERLTMPKFIVNAFLDEFQQPDDTHYWWKDLPEPKHFLMTPNAEHSESTGILEIVPAIGTWLSYQLEKAVVPTFTWDISESTGEITATLDDTGIVHAATLYWGYSCGNNVDFLHGSVKRRDFRVVSVDAPCKCGLVDRPDVLAGYCLNTQSFESKRELTATIEDGKRVYRAQMAAPEDGRYVAYFMDIKYEKSPEVTTLAGLEPHYHGFMPLDAPGQLDFTTEVSVWPNTFPYDDCEGSGCKDTSIV
jgi:PhoPQ-activated pathogenicity-related protein